MSATRERVSVSSEPSVAYTPEDTPEPESRTSSKARAPLSDFSVWDYLVQEVISHDYDQGQDEKEERVSNFLSVPVQLEKVRARRT